MKFKPFDLIGNAVRKQAKKNNEVIFGARSLRRQLGVIGLGRSTQDYDVLSKNPKRSAVKLERTLDKRAGRDQYYTEPALHPGTTKVMDRGFDRRKGTKDDFGVADYGKLKRGFKTVKVNGVKYSHLSEEAKNRRKSLSDPKSSFRHKKDRHDLNLINASRRLKRY